jgi:hypothetical protein
VKEKLGILTSHIFRGMYIILSSSMVLAQVTTISSLSACKERERERERECCRVRDLFFSSLLLLLPSSFVEGVFGVSFFYCT